MGNFSEKNPNDLLQRKRFTCFLHHISEYFKSYNFKRISLFGILRQKWNESVNSWLVTIRRLLTTITIISHIMRYFKSINNGGKTAISDNNSSFVTHRPLMNSPPPPSTIKSIEIHRNFSGDIPHQGGSRRI